MSSVVYFLLSSNYTWPTTCFSPGMLVETCISRSHRTHHMLSSYSRGFITRITSKWKHASHKVIICLTWCSQTSDAAIWKPITNYLLKQYKLPFNLFKKIIHALSFVGLTEIRIFPSINASPSPLQYHTHGSFSVITAHTLRHHSAAWNSGQSSCPTIIRHLTTIIFG